LNNLQYKSAFVENDVDSNQLLATIGPRKWQILGFVVAVTLLSVFLAYSITPTYKATATLLIEPEQSKLLPVVDPYTQSETDTKFYKTQLEIIKSRKLILRVIRDLKLDSYDEFASGEMLFSSNPKLSHPLSLNDKPVAETDRHLYRTIRYFQKQLTVKLIKDTKLISVSFESENPELAAKVANALANAYINDQLSLRIKTAKKAVDWIDQRLKSLKKNLRISEQNMQDYMQKNGLLDVLAMRTLASQKLKDLTSQVVMARRKYIGLSKRYGDKHPKLIASKSELQAAERALQRAKLKIQHIGHKEVKLRELKSRVDSDRILTDTFIKHLKGARQALDINSVNIRISDPAVAPFKPNKPKKVLIVMAAFLSSLMLGILLAFAYGMLDKTFKSAKDIEQRLGLDVLGLLPWIKNNSATNTFGVLEPNQKAFTEAMCSIRTELILPNTDHPHKRILITSSVSGEGKTFVAMNLAIAMAKMEKVLLIEADLRHPSIFQSLDLDDGAFGMSNIVTNSVPFKCCIQHISQANLDVLNSGQLCPNPLEILSSERFKIMIKALANHYDRIVIDSPATNLAGDTLVLSKLSDAIVYVVEANVTSEDVAKSCLNRLLKHHAPVVGVVLNKCNTKTMDVDDYQFESNKDTDML